MDIRMEIKTWKQIIQHLLNSYNNMVKKLNKNILTDKPQMFAFGNKTTTRHYWRCRWGAM
jgi:hypothetical protein